MDGSLKWHSRLLFYFYKDMPFFLYKLIVRSIRYSPKFEESKDTNYLLRITVTLG